jgi:hypothetical protein
MKKAGLWVLCYTLHLITDLLLKFESVCFSAITYLTVLEVRVANTLYPPKKRKTEKRK